ncbi:hypothetical Protein YC6258_04023 [Gynuella sunshinyii YC6258]|uniref:Uncharacterized protein n=1 Tax=Gynuella sunshinyii YC6258 TaxID=1445510 RepID=A0A0C5W055_9GAMM|nr:hypothetical Protein YC6258_04023 [Gynuella sunshinyii YC6258]
MWSSTSCFFDPAYAINSEWLLVLALFECQAMLMSLSVHPCSCTPANALGELLKRIK